MASDITSKGAVLYDLLGKEVELRVGLLKLYFCSCPKTKLFSNFRRYISKFSPKLGVDIHNYCANNLEILFYK